MRKTSGFSVIELAVAVVVIAILVTLSLPVIGKMRARAQRLQCMANLRSLYLGAELYLQNNGSWPQIRASGADDNSADYANAWIMALTPFNVGRSSWICPTMQEILEQPDYSTPEHARVDYFAMPFGDKPDAPHRRPDQPWFVERRDVHGGGNLIIFTDGSINDSKTLLGVTGRTP